MQTKRFERFVIHFFVVALVACVQYPTVHICAQTFDLSV